jgi:hypothetical protein
VRYDIPEKVQDIRMSRFGVAALAEILQNQVKDIVVVMHGLIYPRTWNGTWVSLSIAVARAEERVNK